MDGSSWATAYTGLKQALAAATAGDEIRIADGTYIPFNEVSPPYAYELKAGVTLRGGYAGLGAADPDSRDIAAHPTILSGNGIGRIMNASVANAVVDGFTFDQGYINGSTYVDQISGGAIYAYTGSLTIRNCTFTNNFASGFGGAVYAGHSTVTITDSSFSDNRTNGSGGAVSFSEAAGSVADCTFARNKARNFGAGVHFTTLATGITFAIDRSTFTDNDAGLDGGGAWSNVPTTVNDSAFLRNRGREGAGLTAWGTGVTINRCHFELNVFKDLVGGPAERGGAVFASSPTEINDSTFIANEAGDGGAVYGGNLTMRRCVLLNNKAHFGYGGAVRGFRADFFDTTFEGNYSVYHGGAVSLSGNTTASFTRCAFTRNRANPNVNVGGAIYSDGPSLAILDSTFNGNAAANGGGIFVHSTQSGATLTVTNSTFVGQEAWSLNGGDGAAIYTSGFPGGAKITNCTLTGNVGERGSAVYNSSGAVTVANSIVWSNTATIGGVIDKGTGSGTTVAVSWSDVQGTYVGTGNLNADPKFVRTPAVGVDAKWGTADDDYGDLRLQFPSPCIDAGNNGSIPASIATDIDGQPRFFDFPGVKSAGAVIDMGAHELGLTLGLLSVAAGQKLVLPGGGHTFTVERLVMNEGATLDVLTNTLIIKKTDETSFADVAAMVRTGYDGGEWFGTGLMSRPAGADQTQMTALGYADNAELKLTEFEGVTGLTGNEIFVKYTYYGDADLNGIVDPDDFNQFLAGFQDSSVPRTWLYGDFDYNNVIDPDDFNLFLAAFQANGIPL